MNIESAPMIGYRRDVDSPGKYYEVGHQVIIPQFVNLLHLLAFRARRSDGLLL
jgi:hypothetical protein